MTSLRPFLRPWVIFAHSTIDMHHDEVLKAIADAMGTAVHSNIVKLEHRMINFIKTGKKHPNTKNKYEIYCH